MLSHLGMLAFVSCARFAPSADVAPEADAPAAPSAMGDFSALDQWKRGYVGDAGPGWYGLTLHELTEVDVRGAAFAAQVVLESAEARPAEAREMVGAALQVLQVTCPYNRAAVQLPIALRAAVAETDPNDLDPLIQADWRYLQQGLDAHVATLDVFGASLPLPTEADYLYGRLFPDAPITRAQLEAADDPIRATMPLLASIRFVVDEYTSEATETIEQNRLVVYAGTGEMWPLKHQMLGWRSALTKLQPFLTEEGRKAQVAQMIEALDTFAGLGC